MSELEALITDGTDGDGSNQDELHIDGRLMNEQECVVLPRPLRSLSIDLRHDPLCGAVRKKQTKSSVE